jgi:hypothetical protein
MAQSDLKPSTVWLQLANIFLSNLLKWLDDWFCAWFIKYGSLPKHLFPTHLDGSPASNQHL